jgi:hypothetical protein
MVIANQGAVTYSSPTETTNTQARRCIMAAIEIKMGSGSAVRNIPTGADVQAWLERAQADYPECECSVIGTQSFDAGPICVAGPEGKLAAGY